MSRRKNHEVRPQPHYNINIYNTGLEGRDLVPVPSEDVYYHNNTSNNSTIKKILWWFLGMLFFISLVRIIWPFLLVMVLAVVVGFAVRYSIKNKNTPEVDSQNHTLTTTGNPPGGDTQVDLSGDDRVVPMTSHFPATLNKPIAFNVYDETGKIEDIVTYTVGTPVALRAEDRYKDSFSVEVNLRIGDQMFHNIRALVSTDDLNL